MKKEKGKTEQKHMLYFPSPPSIFESNDGRGVSRFPPVAEAE
jgi:hypothetical protein